MSTRVRLVLLSLVITLLVMWLPATSFARSIRVKGRLVSQNEQTKAVEIKLTGVATYDGDTIGTVHLKGIPESDLSVLSKLEWGQRGTIVELIAELDLTVKYPRKQYHPLIMAATFVEWSGRMAELMEEGKALAAQKAEQEAQAKKEAAEREERERKEAVERAAREEQERKAALERAAKAEKEAKEAAEREARKQQELEAQPPRELVGKALNVAEGNTVFVEVGSLTYKIRNVSPICLVADEEVKVTVRRVDPDPKSEVLYHCDFVSFDPDWQKALDKKVAEAESKEVSLKAKEEKLQAQKDALIANLQAEQEKLEGQKEATTLFTVYGRIQNKEKNAIQLWGQAVPTKGVLNHWAMQTKETVIIILNPKTMSSGAYYTGSHYFVKKASGKNAYGGSVPIWVFGDLPPKVKSETDAITSNMEKYRARILEIEQEVKFLSSEMGKVICIPEK